MKTRLLYVISLIGLFTAFWACGDGEVYTPNYEDEIALEKLSKLDDDDLEEMMEKCRADAKCLAEMEKYPMESSSSEVEELSSSSEEEPESSSEEESSSAADTSAADTTASSSDEDPESSSSKKVEESSSSVESSAESSSEKAESSSSKEESSSSEDEDSSSSVESSSDESSSSEQEPDSSSSEPAKPKSSSSAESSSSLLPAHGTCVLTNSEGKSVTAVKLNEPVTWTYIPDEGTSVEGTYLWNYGNPEILEGGRRTISVKVRYSERGDFSANFKIASVQVCDAVPVTVLSTVYEDPNVSSSSNDDTPDQSATSSTNPTSGGTVPGVTPGVTPEGGTSSSMSSSSSAESSSSESSSSSEDVTPINEDMSGKTYQPGSYKVVFSNGLKSEVCNVHFEDHSNKINDVFKFPESENGGLWDNDYGRTVTIVPGVEFSFTSGTLKIESCWNQSW